MPALLICGLVLWLGYLGCSAMGDWDSLYILASSHPAVIRPRISSTVLERSPCNGAWDRIFYTEKQGF